MRDMIVRNSARCLKCGDEIESKHRHDFVLCKCGAIFVDGGAEYLRCGADDWANFESTSVTEPWPVLIGGERMPIRTHGRGKCVGEYCTIHKPSTHHLLADFPQHWSAGYVARVCPHGVEFVDPDEVRVPKLHIKVCQRCGISQDAFYGTLEALNPPPGATTRETAS